MRPRSLQRIIVFSILLFLLLASLYTAQDRVGEIKRLRVFLTSTDAVRFDHLFELAKKVNCQISLNY
jgi:hypothetical protein